MGEITFSYNYDIIFYVHKYFIFTETLNLSNEYMFDI